MSKSNEKKKNAQNQKIVQNHTVISLGIYALYLLYRFLYHYGTLSKTVMTLFTVSSLIFAYALKSIRSSAVPYIDERGHITVLTDLTQVSGSLMEYMFDIVYVQWIILVLGLVTDRTWWLWLIVPVFALYKILSFVLPFLTGRGGGAGGLPGALMQGMMGGGMGSGMGSGMMGGAGAGGGGDDDDESSGSKKRMEKKQRKEELQQRRMKNVRM